MRMVDRGEDKDSSGSRTVIRYAWLSQSLETQHRWQIDLLALDRSLSPSQNFLGPSPQLLSPTLQRTHIPEPCCAIWRMLQTTFLVFWNNITPWKWNALGISDNFAHFSLTWSWIQPNSFLWRWGRHVVAYYGNKMHRILANYSEYVMVKSNHFLVIGTMMPQWQQSGN